jgi:hypothetical protein
MMLSGGTLSSGKDGLTAFELPIEPKEKFHPREIECAMALIRAMERKSAKVMEEWQVVRQARAFWRMLKAVEIVEIGD